MPCCPQRHSCNHSQSLCCTRGAVLRLLPNPSSGPATHQGEWTPTGRVREEKATRAIPTLSSVHSNLLHLLAAAHAPHHHHQQHRHHTHHILSNSFHTPFHAVFIISHAPYLAPSPPGISGHSIQTFNVQLMSSFFHEVFSDL